MQCVVRKYFLRDCVLVKPFLQKTRHRENANLSLGTGLGFSYHASGHKTPNLQFGVGMMWAERH